MRLLDLFCGAGGAAMGYHRAGFDEIVGVDLEAQPRYPFEFVRADALEYLAEHGREFDVIHTSPICKAFTVLQSVRGRKHPNQIPAVRNLLKRTGKPYVIENVPGAPLANPILLCGTMFGLKVIRHRIFETSPVIWFPPMACCHNTGGIPQAGRGPSRRGFWSVAGKGGAAGTKDGWAKAMDIDWMILNELAQAIPPAYTEWLGRRLLEVLRREAAA